VFDDNASSLKLIIEPVIGNKVVFLADDITALKSKVNAAAGYTATYVTSDKYLIIENNDVAFYATLSSESTNSHVHEIEFGGQALVGQTWSLEVGGRTMEYRIVNSSAFNGDADQWVKSGTKDLYYAMSFRKPRLTSVAEAFEDVLTTDADFNSKYSVQRDGRILRITEKNGNDVAVSSTFTRSEENSPDKGSINVQRIGAELIHQVKFTASNWNVPQEVHVRAINDDFIDGTDALVFAPLEERVNSVRGPITINGGFSHTNEKFLTNPVRLPGELNDPLADGVIESFGVVSEGGEMRAYIDDVDANHINPGKGLRPGFEPRMNDFPYTIEFLDGAAAGLELGVHSVSKDILSIGNNLDAFNVKILNLGAVGLQADLYAEMKDMNAEIYWNMVRYSFGSNLNDLQKDEKWTVNLGTEPHSVNYNQPFTFDGEVVPVTINTRGRLVNALKQEINNKSSEFSAEVRYGLRGEVDLIVSKVSGGSFKSEVNRAESSKSVGAIVQQGFVDQSKDYPADDLFTMAAIYLRGIPDSGGKDS